MSAARPANHPNSLWLQVPEAGREPGSALPRGGWCLNLNKMVQVRSVRIRTIFRAGGTTFMMVRYVRSKRRGREQRPVAPVGRHQQILIRKPVDPPHASGGRRFLPGRRRRTVYQPVRTLDAFARLEALEVEQLRHDDVGNSIVDRSAQEHDAFLE